MRLSPARTSSKAPEVRAPDAKRLAKGFVARVTNVRIVDGDSIECDFKGQRTRVRLYGIDAPELEQPGGAESSENLGAIMRGMGALMMEVMDYDRYGRLVGLLHPANSNRRDSVSLRMVREGQAYAFTRFGGAEIGMRTAERDAKAGKRGLWRSQRATAERPWEYRKRNREGTGVSSAIWLMMLVMAALLAVGLGVSMGWLG